MFELLFPVSERWEVTTLGDVCAAGGGNIQTGPFGSQLHASDYVAAGTPSVMPQNIGDNVINDDGIARIRDADVNRLSRYLLNEGDIVYSRRGDVTRRALVREEQQGWLCGTGCLRIRIGTNADPRFVSYYLGHPQVREWITRHAVGATMLNLNTKILSALPVALPPSGEQYAIAYLLSALDDKIAVNDRIASTALELCSTLFAEALAKDSDLSTITLGDVSAVNLHKASPIDGCAIRYIDISSVSVDRYEWPKLTAWEEAPSRARRKAFAGDIIWSTVRPNRKSRALILDGDPNIIASTGFAVLTPTKVGSAFLYEATRREEFVTYLESVAEGSAYPAVRADRFTKAVIPMLSDSRMAKFESEAMQIHHRIHVARKENRFLAELRDGLLPKLMSGEVRIKDAEKVVEDAV